MQSEYHNSAGKAEANTTAKQQATATFHYKRRMTKGWRIASRSGAQIIPKSRLFNVPSSNDSFFLFIFFSFERKCL